MLLYWSCFVNYKFFVFEQNDEPIEQVWRIYIYLFCIFCVLKQSCMAQNFFAGFSKYSMGKEWEKVCLCEDINVVQVSQFGERQILLLTSAGEMKTGGFVKRKSRPGFSMFTVQSKCLLCEAGSCIVSQLKLSGLCLE